MLNPQFLYALLYVANKRHTGFQEVVSHILENVSALPNPSMADLVIFRSKGTEEEKEEYLERPRGLPRPERDVSGLTDRMRKEAQLAIDYGLPVSTNMNKSLHCTLCSVAQLAIGDTMTSVPAGEEAETPKLVVGGGATGTARVDKDFQDETESLPDYEQVADASKLHKWGLKGAGQARNLTPDNLLMALKTVFERYNLYEGGVNKGQMDRMHFSKVMRDVRLVSEHPNGLGTTKLDRMFTKVLPPMKNTLNFVQFVETLRHIATFLRVTLNEIMERIVIMQRPA
eukprot:gene9954-7830_t